MYLWLPNQCQYLDLRWHTPPPLHFSPPVSLPLLFCGCCQGLSVGLLAHSCQPVSSPGRTITKWDIMAAPGGLPMAAGVSSDHQAAVFMWWRRLRLFNAFAIVRGVSVTSLHFHTCINNSRESSLSGMFDSWVFSDDLRLEYSSFLNNFYIYFYIFQQESHLIMIMTQFRLKKKKLL